MASYCDVTVGGVTGGCERGPDDSWKGNDTMQKSDGDTTAAGAFDPRALLAESRLGVLATIKADGRPQLSPVMPFYDQEAEVIYVSTSAGAAKTVSRRPGRRSSRSRG